MIQQVLTSPVYAGVFVYGRRRQEIGPGDPPVVTLRRQPLEEWDIVVPGVYPAYLGYDQYLLNRRHLQDNLYNFAAKRPGAPREGRALLHQAFRTRRGQSWEWRLLHSPASAVGREREESHHHA
jgi:hypothetical protein